MRQRQATRNECHELTQRIRGIRYKNLLHRLTSTDYAAAVTQINQLIDQGDLTPDEQDLLTLLGTLVMAYENEHYPDFQFELRGVALLRTMINETGLREDDLLPVFRTKAALTAALHEEQPLTTEQIDNLATFFDLPTALFVASAQLGERVTA